MIENARTTRWHEDEKFTVGKIKCVYIGKYPEVYSICLPGHRKPYTKEQLEVMGYQIKHPTMIRQRG